MCLIQLRRNLDFPVLPFPKILENRMNHNICYTIYLLVMYMQYNTAKGTVLKLKICQKFIIYYLQ